MVSSLKGLSLCEKKYDAKLPKLYQIRGRADVQYSGRVQRAQIQEKKEYSRPVLLNIHFLVSTEKNQCETT